MRDEAEIRGHRRTYVGALPGPHHPGHEAGRARTTRSSCSTRSTSSGADFRGDPAAALLEVLDPEQNNTFRDHYLDVPFDLSKVMFIATANMLDPIPPALRDRMEVLELPGYTREEKLRDRASSYLVPKQLDEHGLDDEQLELHRRRRSTTIIEQLHARGRRPQPRARDRQRHPRRSRCKVAEGEPNDREGRRAERSREILGPAEVLLARWRSAPRSPGVATGLAWTPVGGDILFIEATRMPGKGSLILTGQLGDVMKESAQAALSCVRTHAEELGIDDRLPREDATSTSTSRRARSRRTARRRASTMFDGAGVAADRAAACAATSR